MNTIKTSILIILVTFVFFTRGMLNSTTKAKYRKEVLQLIEQTPDLSYLTNNSLLLTIVKYKKLTGLVRLMLKHKANPNVHDNTELGNTPLHDAAQDNNTQATLLLLQAGANSNSKNKKFADTPLHLAVRYGSYDAVHILLRFGAHPNEKNNYGYTPLHEALREVSFDSKLHKNRTKIIKLLLHYSANPLAQNNYQKNALNIIRHKYKVALCNLKKYQITTDLHNIDSPYFKAEAEKYKKIALLLIAYVGLYTKQGRIAHQGLAQVLPLEIAYYIASYLPEYAFHHAEY